MESEWPRLLVNSFKKQHSSQPALAICGMALLATSATKSVGNLLDLNQFVNNSQPRYMLCIGHHMDRSMHLTSAGKCPVFPKGAADKNIYDSWWGPGR